MRRLVLLLCTAALITANGCHAQPFATDLPANTIIPTPPPTAALSQWQNALGRSTLSLETDGVTLRGYRFAGSNLAGPTILFFNGNGMTIARSAGLYRSIASLGPTVIVYDYRGYGFSTGTADLAAFRRDALKLYDRTVITGSAHPVIIFGYSMGTAVGTYLATQRTPAALILAAAIASATEEFPVYARAMGYPPSVVAQLHPAPDAIDIFGEARLIIQCKAPLLVLHGDADELVPIAQGQEIFAASPSPVKKFVVLPGATHNNTPGNSDTLKAIAALLAALTKT